MKLDVMLTNVLGKNMSVQFKLDCTEFNISEALKYSFLYSDLYKSKYIEIQ